MLCYCYLPDKKVCKANAVVKKKKEKGKKEIHVRHLAMHIDQSRKKEKEKKRCDS